MKKVFKLTALMLLVGALVMGCKNNGDPDALPGTWTNTAKLYQSWDPPFDVGTLSASDYTVTYELKQPSAMSAEDKPSKSGTYKPISYNVTKDQNFTGFRATVNSNITGGCGFIFCRNVDENGKWSYYYMYINRSGKFYIERGIKGDWAIVKNWDESDAANGKTNEVLVYTDKNKNIVVKINGNEVATIKDPELKSGGVGVVCTVGYDDVIADTPLKAVYQFKEFQY